MFENENTEIESTQSDVTQDSSSESQSDAQTPTQEAGAAKTTEVPFHEHPRWKEVMEERNAERQRATALEQQIAAMQRQLQESLKPKTVEQDPMYERLKGIDPEFADYMKGLKTRAEKAEALEARLEQFEQNQFATSAKATFSELNTKNNVSPELASLYEQQLEAAYSRGEFKDVNGMRQAYDRIHSGFSKLLEAREREALAKYTETKKQASKTPSSQPKGRAPTSNQKVEFSKNPLEARAQLGKLIAAQLKAGRE